MRAVVGFLRRELPGAKVSVQLVCSDVQQYPYSTDEVPLIENYPAFRHLPEVPFAFLSGGRLAVSRAGRAFFRALREADVVIHAPGGPSLGDVYARAERPYLLRLLAVVWQKKPLFFWAPSLGPFENRGRNLLRRFIFNRAAFICTREEISAAALRGLGVRLPVEAALDAAFLGDDGLSDGDKLLAGNQELQDFLAGPAVGMTVTDLAWHPLWGRDKALRQRVTGAFDEFIDCLRGRGYRILFFPQLFGEQDDFRFLTGLVRGRPGCMVLPPDYDALIQQCLMGQVRLAVGMRYHASIFAAKAGTPFIAAAYEEKTRGFMRKIGLEKYCLELENLTADLLCRSFEELEREEAECREYLKSIGPGLQAEAEKAGRRFLELAVSEEVGSRWIRTS